MRFGADGKSFTTLLYANGPGYKLNTTNTECSHDRENLTSEVTGSYIRASSENLANYRKNVQKSSNSPKRVLCGVAKNFDWRNLFSIEPIFFSISYLRFQTRCFVFAALCKFFLSLNVCSPFNDCPSHLI